MKTPLSSDRENNCHSQIIRQHPAVHGITACTPPVVARILLPKRQFISVYSAPRQPLIHPFIHSMVVMSISFNNFPPSSSQVATSRTPNWVEAAKHEATNNS